MNCPGCFEGVISQRFDTELGFERIRLPNVECPKCARKFTWNMGMREQVGDIDP